MGRYRFIVISEAKPGREQDYADFCLNTHYPDMLRVPGIVGVQRMKVLTAPGSPDKFVAIFRLETDDPTEVTREIGRRNGTPEMVTSDAYERTSVQLMLAEVVGEW